MNFTDDSFEVLKNRYLQKIRFARNKFLNDARNTDTAAEAFGLSFLITINLPMDELNTNSLYRNYYPKDPMLKNQIRTKKEW